MTRVLGAIFIGSLFLWMQAWALGKSPRNSYWWLLGVLISSALLFLCYATSVFRAALWEMYAKTESPEQSEYLQEVRRKLSDRRFLQAGLFFGVLNLSMGFMFGIPYSGMAAATITCFGFFLVGFVCGMPAQGIYGVVNVVQAFAHENRLRLDFTDPDSCGGLRFLGAVLIKFSSITLVQGVLIAWYILHTWTGNKSPLVDGLRIFWIAFPFLLSLLVLFVPASAISRRLKAFKLEKSTALQNRIESLRERLDSTSDVHQQDSLQKTYDYNVTLRMELYKMHTWPCNLGSSVKYSSVFLANAGVALINANDEWDFLIKTWHKIKPG